MSITMCIDVGFKNLSWCIVKNPSSDNNLNYIILDHRVKSIYSKNVKKCIDWDEVNENLINLFQEIFLNYKINNIFIEKQIYRNLKACMLSTSIFSCLFTICNLQEKTIPIAFLDPKKKLNSLTPFNDLFENEKKMKNIKKEAIRRLNILIESDIITYENDENLFYVQSKSKQDDLADSLLMCLSFQ